MVTVTEFIVVLLTSLVRLFQVFITDVALADPLSFVAFAFGGLFVTVSVAFFGYLVLGAVADLFGGVFSFEAGAPPQQE